MTLEERVTLLEHEVADLKRLTAIAPVAASDPVKNNGTPKAT